ncbi:MAG: rod shape-determining protein RodA [bacterium]
MWKRLFQEIDYPAFLAMVFLILLGLLLIYSATLGSTPSKEASIRLVSRQAVWAGISLFLFFLMASIDYRQLPRFSSLIYFLMFLMLVLVLILGKKTSGAQRWFAIGPITIQPSEFAKIMVLITLSSFWAKNYQSANKLNILFRSFVHIAIPLLLVFLQPDLGTSLTFLLLWLASLLFVGAKVKHIVAIALSCIVFAIGAWHFNILRPYQKQRISAFLNPYSDPLGAGYHIIQSRIAIGSGEVWGKGLFKGTQNRLNYIPAQHTDFIFTVAGEELGFAGCLLILTLFFILIWRCFSTAIQTEDMLGQLIAAQVGVLLLFQAFVNIGMTLGLLPAVGIPLPFLSYGGSHLVSFCLMLGITQSIYRRRKKISF